MATEHHTVGRGETKTEMKISLKEIPTSMGNETNMVKEVTGLLVVGKIKDNKKTIM